MSSDEREEEEEKKTKSRGKILFKISAVLGGFPLGPNVLELLVLEIQLIFGEIQERGRSENQENRIDYRV